MRHGVHDRPATKRGGGKRSDTRQQSCRRTPPRSPPRCTRRPPAPRLEAGLGPEILSGLILKQLYQIGDITGTDLARRLGLEFSVIESRAQRPSPLEPV